MLEWVELGWFGLDERSKMGDRNGHWAEGGRWEWTWGWTWMGAGIRLGWVAWGVLHARIHEVSWADG